MVKKSKKEEKIDISKFENEISRLPNSIKKKILLKKETIEKFIGIIKSKIGEKVIGFYISPEFEIIKKTKQANFDKLKLHFLLNDFEKSIIEFNPRLLLGNNFDKILIEKIEESNSGKISKFYLKEDESIEFIGSSISILRENCFDSIYDDLKILGSSIIFLDDKGFISALKTIEIQKNMLLQKFEKYIVVYAGVGSWLRAEKSNDFDVFIVIDDTDVKRMPRLQVKDQLTRIIWQMSNEVAQFTGIQIHIQVYLLTDFWDALKDAHPVMFTFLRDGVPFYDRGIYNSWKALLKLGKIRPSPEAIDMHMNIGVQLIDRSKKMFADIVLNEIYNAVLSPSQAILMLKGYNPTTPKETVKMFKEVLLEKEKSISKKDVETLEKTIKTFKNIEHNKNFHITGLDVDIMIKDAELFLKNIKKMFEEISEQKTKDSIISSYNELITQLRNLPFFKDLSEEKILELFKKQYLESKKLSEFTYENFKIFFKAKGDYEKGKITVTEVNKALKSLRNVLSEIKIFVDSNIVSSINSKKLKFFFDNKKNAEVFSYKNEIFLINFTTAEVFILLDKNFVKTERKINEFSDMLEFQELKLNIQLIEEIKKILKVEDLILG